MRFTPQMSAVCGAVRSFLKHKKILFLFCVVSLCFITSYILFYRI